MFPGGGWGFTSVFWIFGAGCGEARLFSIFGAGFAVIAYCIFGFKKSAYFEKGYSDITFR